MEVTFERVVPVLRIFDIDKARVRAYHAELNSKEYGYLRPGIDVDEIGTCLSLLDPFGNTLRLNEKPAS